jgi:hypothetical protein
VKFVLVLYCSMKLAQCAVLFMTSVKREKKSQQGFHSQHQYLRNNKYRGCSEYRANVSFCPKKGIFCKNYETFFFISILFYSRQMVTRRCRLSWLTNSALVYKLKCGGGERLRDLPFQEACSAFKTAFLVSRDVRKAACES